MFAPVMTMSTFLPASDGALFEHCSESHGTGRLGDAAQRFPQHADGSTDFRIRDRGDAAEHLAADLKRQRPGFADGGAIAEDVEIVKVYRLARFESGFHGGLANAPPRRRFQCLANTS